MFKNRYFTGFIILTISALSFASGYALQDNRQMQLQTSLEGLSIALTNTLISNKENSKFEALINIGLLEKLKNGDSEFVITWLQRDISKQVKLDPATQFFIEAGGTGVAQIDEVHEASKPSDELIQKTKDYQRVYCSGEPCLGLSMTSPKE